MIHSENEISTRLENPATGESDRFPSKDSLFSGANWCLVIAIALGVFLAAALAMIAIHPWYHLSAWNIAFVEAFLLILLISPVLYFFLFRPLIQHINERQRAKQALRESKLCFRTIFRTSPDFNIIARIPTGLQTKVNPIRKWKLRILRVDSVNIS